MSAEATTPSSSPSEPAPSQSAPPSQKFPSGGNSGNLYLVTFLATLFLLLAISCAIVLRSYILRRRFQRQLDDAMAAGVLLAPRTQGARKLRFGPRPRFYDSWIVSGGDKWDEMMPVSALPVQVKRRPKNGTASTSSAPLLQHQPSSIQQSSTPSASARPFIHRLFHDLRRHSSRRTDAEQTPTPEPEKQSKPRLDMLQVSVLVAMPSPRKNERDDDKDDEHIPELVLGVTRMPYKPARQSAAAPPPSR